MNEKEIYEKPEIIVIEFSIEDSIATSGAMGNEGIWSPPAGL